MEKESVDKSIWRIFFEGLKIYCFNFHKFVLYMLFPVFGQLLGMLLVFGLLHVYSEKLPALIKQYPVFDDFTTIVLCALLLVVPGLLIFTKAFLDFLVAYGALNSMADAATTINKVYDFKSHTQLITRKSFSFMGLWFLFGIFTAAALFPLFWVPGLILFIYFILIFQVFTFENDLSPVGCFKRSYQLIQGNFARTSLLAVILGIFTYYLLPLGVSVVFADANLTPFLDSMFNSWIATLPLEPVYRYIPAAAIVGMLVNSFISFIVVGMTLPLRSICWSLWYKNVCMQKL